MDKICPKTEKCPLFQGEILVSTVAQEIYQDLYCTNGINGRSKCMRFQLSNAINGPVSQDVMPNDKRSLEELLKKYSKS